MAVNLSMSSTQKNYCLFFVVVVRLFCFVLMRAENPEKLELQKGGGQPLDF